METTSIQVVMETMEHRFEGAITLPKDGYGSRLSDYLNQGDLRFAALTDVTITDLDTGQGYEREFAAVGLNHVVLAFPR